MKNKEALDMLNKCGTNINSQYEQEVLYLINGVFEQYEELKGKIKELNPIITFNNVKKLGEQIDELRKLAGVKK